ncbi:MAG TPA: ATP-dependent transcriptional regulator, partial [Halieaceae bacterium]|nr:ATP-dependent transcriptional regulator [Halieaceae bacterium]HBX74060.1 ATP-dependent transcriptional regulator [Halieaceae bacterium]
MRQGLLLALLLPLAAWGMRPLETPQAVPETSGLVGAPYTAPLAGPPPAFVLPAGNPATLVIIIDDLGNRLKEGRQT